MARGSTLAFLVGPHRYCWRMGTTDAWVDRRVTVADEVALHVRQWQGERRPFLLVHGLSSNARLWRRR